MGLPPPRRAGSSARRRFLLIQEKVTTDITASVRRASPRGLYATAVVTSEHGSWSGTVWSSVSSSQRILSLWLDRLSTDRIARQWRETIAARSSPLPASGERGRVVFGKRGNLDLLVAVDETAQRLGLRAGLTLAQ